MKKHVKITTALALATTALSPDLVAETKAIGEWDLSSAVLFYSEKDRVSAIEPVINARKYLDTDEFINIKLTLDTLSGASPSGAVPSATGEVQTYTTPSGNTRTVRVGEEIPQEDFSDDRIQISASWDRPIGSRSTMSLGANFSNETDYLSSGLSALFSTDSKDGNRTYSYGAAYSSDKITPVGGAIPTAFSTPDSTLANNLGSSDAKLVSDVLLGVTQVIDRRSLIQFNYSLSSETGYLTDPYKLISVINPVTGVTQVYNSVTNSPYLQHENRPDSRTKQSLYTQYKRQTTDGNVFDLSYRYMFDDWGIKSNTLDFKYRINTRHWGYIQPHVRLYQQSQADFYHAYYLDGDQPIAGSTTTYGSSDYRLGAFDAVTFGFEYGPDNTENSWSTSLEYYKQVGQEPYKFGQLEDIKLSPGLDALMFRINYDW